VLRNVCPPNFTFCSTFTACFSASGTVVQATDTQTSNVVAIKKMDLENQPKKELLITEIEVPIAHL